MELSAFDRELVDLIHAVRDHPGVLLGGRSFERLDGFISGYICAGELTEFPLLQEFSRWLRTHTGIEQEAGWPQFIRFISVTDAGAFDVFMHQFETFLADRRVGFERAMQVPRLFTDER